MARPLKADVLRYVQGYMEKTLPSSTLELLAAPTAAAKRDILQIEVVVGPKGDPGPRGIKGDTAPLRENYHFVGTLIRDHATGGDVTPVTLTGLSFSYLPNSVYRIWFMGRVQPGMEYEFQLDLSSVGLLTDIQSLKTDVVCGQGLLVTSSNIGTAQLRFRSLSPAVITVLAGLTLVVEKVA